MKELSGIIEVYPISGLTPDFAISELASGKFEKFDFHANEFKLEINPEESASGTIYNCDKDILVDQVSQSAIKKFRIRTSCIIRLRDTDGNNIILGSYYLPATVLLTPNLQRFKLSIKCKMLNSPY